MMKKLRLLGLLLLATQLTVPAFSGAQDFGATAGKVRHDLVMLSRLSVFDNLTYRLVGDTVYLGGQVAQPVLKSDAENALKGIEGVKVVNQIEVLSLSPIRRRPLRRREQQGHSHYRQERQCDAGRPSGQRHGTQRRGPARQRRPQRILRNEQLASRKLSRTEDVPFFHGPAGLFRRKRRYRHRLVIGFFLVANSGLARLHGIAEGFRLVERTQKEKLQCAIDP
jgi:hypothetical protein